MDICVTVEGLKPIPRHTLVYWGKPKKGWIKINIDGSYLLDNGKARIGGIIRNWDGELIMTFSCSVKCHSNNMCEALTAKFGVQWCVRHGYAGMILELDSQLVTNMLIDRSTNNYKMSGVVVDIMQDLDQSNVLITHRFREANQVAGFLAKLASSSGNNSFLYTYQELPKSAKGLFFMDKCQLSSIRTRYDKANFFVS